MTHVDDEIECPGCHALVNVAHPLGVELRVIEVPSCTSEASSVTVILGSDVVHHCRFDDRQRPKAGRR